MNVFKIEYVGNFGGGMAIVAADSETEAMEVFLSAKRHARYAPENYEVTEFLEGLSWEGNSQVICSNFFIE